MFGVAFHDFGKIYELSYKDNFAYTDEGRLIGHLVIGTCVIDRKIRETEGFPKDLELQLKHLILSHHGKLEFGSPKIPQTVEAILVHYLDVMDSRLEAITAHIKKDASSNRWTPYLKAFDSSYFKGSLSKPPENS